MAEITPPSDALAWPPGWETPSMAAICEACDWQYLAPAGQPMPVCPACRRSALAPTSAYPETPRPPELVAPFVLSESDLSDALRRFARWRPFSPADFREPAMRSRLRKLYLPRWLLDADIQAAWQAGAGFDYQVVSHQDRFDEARARWESTQVTETRIRWEPRLGRLDRHYDNVAAPAIEEDAIVQRALGDFDAAGAAPYEAPALEGALVRLPNRFDKDVLPEALAALQRLAAEECRQACRAEHLREFQWTPEIRTAIWTQLLLPVYATYYCNDQGVELPVLIHGQSGRVAGQRQASMRRARQFSLVLALVAAAVFALSATMIVLAALGPMQDTALGSSARPALAALGAFGIAVAMGLGVAAAAPVVYVWLTNRAESTSDWVRQV